MNEPPKAWACGHAIPKATLEDMRTIVRPTGTKVSWGERCPACGLSYSEHKALTERKTK